MVEVPVIEMPTLAGGNVKTLDDIIPPQAKVGSAEWQLDQQRMLMQLAADGGRAYTITFTDHNLWKYKEQFLYDTVEILLKKTKGVLRWCLIPEYSETGRYHMHGVILCNTLQSHSRIQRKLRRNFGIIQIKCIDNSRRWMLYCMKQYNDDPYEA